jgi:hypothetical protein
MMHPATASKYVDYQMPVARDFADYLGSERQHDGLVPDLYEKLFKYTMECTSKNCPVSSSYIIFSFFSTRALKLERYASLPIAELTAAFLCRDSLGRMTKPASCFIFSYLAIAAVCFGERIGSFDPASEACANSDARRLSAAIVETFICFRSCMFDFPWYRYFRTPTYRRFERAANTMRQ